jgi:hypothetical protein
VERWSLGVIYCIKTSNCGAGKPRCWATARWTRSRGDRFLVNRPLLGIRGFQNIKPDFKTNWLAVKPPVVRYIYIYIRVQTRVYAGSNTSTVTLRAAGGDEKGSLTSETVKYGCESLGIRTRERLCWRGSEAYIKDGTVLSWERAPHKNQTVTVEQ